MLQKHGKKSCKPKRMAANGKNARDWQLSFTLNCATILLTSFVHHSDLLLAFCWMAKLKQPSNASILDSQISVWAELQPLSCYRNHVLVSGLSFFGPKIFFHVSVTFVLIPPKYLSSSTPSIFSYI
jgi:hypothetical protein